jgi:KUP system potassium uptake protein
MNVAKLKITPKNIPNSLTALGVVFGDIGTSPLYAVSVLFAEKLLQSSQSSISPESIYGNISLIFWAINLIVSIKYLSFVLRADNDGEGGVFSLYALLHQHRNRGIGSLLVLLILAAGLIFGNGLITPALSVFSAVEGLSVLAPQFSDYSVLTTIVILTGLFLLQFTGTHRVGKIFGPVALLWFATIAILGLRSIIAHPEILKAINPLNAIDFLISADLRTIALSLTGVILSITGGEALYADLGHFGKTPIRRNWYTVVYPALLLNYFGQGAFLLSGAPIIRGNIFYSMVPSDWLLPMILLATLATVIASQALITGVFSLTSQATALGLFPRIKVIHTHHENEGQVYSPLANFCLFIGSVSLVLGFKSSTALASAYGFAVAGDMFVTSVAMVAVARVLWRWSSVAAVLVFGGFALIDALFIAANFSQIFDGAYIPCAIALILFLIMLTWRWGRKATFAAYSGLKTMTIQELVHLRTQENRVLDRNVLMMVPREIDSLDDQSPAILQQFWERYRVLPRNLLFVQVAHRKVPFIHRERYNIYSLYRDPLMGSISSVRVDFGFMENPDVESILEDLASHHQINLSQDPKEWIVHVSVENLLPSPKQNFLQRIRFQLFRLLRQVSQPAYYFYGLGRLIHLSVEVLPVRLR